MRNEVVISNKFSFRKDLDLREYRLLEVFAGIEDSAPLRELMPDDVERTNFLDRARVILIARKGYMRVDDENNGTIEVSRWYLETGDPVTIYLDILHELAHVKQFQEGRDLYDWHYSYVDRPTEVEAYSLVVKEAKRLGMHDDDIFDYLFVEWISREDCSRLAQRLGVRVPRRT